MKKWIILFVVLGGLIAPSVYLGLLPKDYTPREFGQNGLYGGSSPSSQVKSDPAELYLKTGRKILGHSVYMCLRCGTEFFMLDGESLEHAHSANCPGHPPIK